MTEAELVKVLRRGSTDALTELIDRYTPYISSVIARILRGRQADVEELTADVFLAVWDNRDKLRPGQVKGYLGTIARNRAFNLLRSEHESLPLEDDILLLETDDPDRLLDRRETARMVNRLCPGWNVPSGNCSCGTTIMARLFRKRRWLWG